MRTIFVVVMATSGCGTPTTEASKPPRPAPVKLNDVQAECRTEEVLSIARADQAFGPGCSGPTMRASLELFDLGSYSGFLDATDWAFSSVTLCVCADGGCSETLTERSMGDVRRIAIEKRRERDGVVDIMNRLASHDCLNATMGAELFKIGFRCAFVTGLKSQLIRHDMAQRFAPVIGRTPAESRTFVDSCMDKPVE